MLLSNTMVRGADPVIRIQPGVNELDSQFVVRDMPEAIIRESARWTDEQWQELFAVYTLLSDRTAPTAVLGEYSLTNRELTFTPRYPLRPGVTYRAVLRAPAAKAAELSRDFAVPIAKAAFPTRLTAIYPTGDVLPENLLKFYLHFSGPMSRGEVYKRVRLIDQQGRRVEYPFLELAEELWSPDGTRLTLYFDPGRIKRGLKPRELFGPALLEGGAYKLEVDADWPDAAGQPLSGLERTIRKSFRVTAPDDQQPDARRWKLLTPQAESRRPLTVVLDEPLDSAMLLRVISVRDPNGERVVGNVEIGKGELSWSFRPLKDWMTGEHKLSAAISLEDLAGNSLGRPFEVDVFRPATNRFDTETTDVSFVIKPAAGP